MARKSHNPLKYIEPARRKGESLTARKAFLIACEGECTEPGYIKDLVDQEKRNRRIAEGTVVMIAPHRHSNPCGVLSDLIEMAGQQSFDERWIVIDRDEVEYKGKGFGGHAQEDFSRAIQESRKNGVKVACSNPCFELWIVLHFEYRDTACGRDDIQRKALEKINSLLPKEKQIRKVDDMKSLENLYSLLRGRTDTACRFAEKLAGNEEEHKNPSTGMYRLVRTILSLPGSQ